MEDYNQKILDYRHQMLSGEYPFVNLKYDAAFKAVFGTPGNEDLLLMLLDAFLPEKHIVSVELGSQEQISDRPDQQHAIYDINCITGDGSSITVEMQFMRQTDFADRMVYYSGFTARNRVGEFPGLHYRLPQIYVIGILNFLMPGVPDNPRVINHYSVRNDVDGSLALTDSMHYITVELPKFTKDIEDLESKADILLFLLRNMERMKDIPMKMMGKNLDKLFSVAKFAAMDAQTQEKYLAQLMWEWDRESQITTGYLDGHEQGLSEGLAKGRVEGLLDTARAMKSNGISVDLIVKCTGLTEEQILNL